MSDSGPERVLDAAQPRAGDTVLELGAGLGAATIAAHERIGDGWVIAVDPSVSALEQLLRLAHEAEANGIMYLVGDIEVLPLPNASVDVVVLRSVLAHAGDLDAAVAELARVLRPGGRLSLCEPLDGAAGRERLGADALVRRLAAAGFRDVAPPAEDGEPPQLYLSAVRG